VYEKRFSVAATVVAICLFSFTAKAGFPVGAGKWLLSPGYYYYSANGYWDANRVFNAYGSNGRFTSNYLGLYGVYGINRNWELVFNVPFVSQTFSQTGVLIQNSSMGDVTAGISYYPEMKNLTTHFSVTGSLIIPLYQNVNYTGLSGITAPNIGFQSVGAEAKISLAGGSENFIKGFYYDVVAGGRQYFSTYGPTQFFFDATLGDAVDEDWKIYANFSTVSSQSNYTSTISDGINRDFSYFRVTAGFGYRVNKTVQLFANLFQDVSGKNIGRGHGFGLFAVIRF